MPRGELVREVPERGCVSFGKGKRSFEKHEIIIITNKDINGSSS